MGIRSSIRRRPRVWTAAAVAVVGLAMFVVLWFEPQKLFLDQKVNEALPTAGPGGTSAPVTEAPATSTATEEPSADPSTDPSPAHSQKSSRPPPPATTAPPAPTGPVLLGSGEFRSLEHHSSGVAKLLRLADGSVYLRFEDLDTSNGPDLRVYLTELPASDDWHGWDQGRYVDLGALKGNVGSQNYLVPAEVEVEGFRSAVIWCRRFKVGFGVAPLDR